MFISLFIYRRRDRSDERPLLNAELMALQALNITVVSIFAIIWQLSVIVFQILLTSDIQLF